MNAVSFLPAERWLKRLLPLSICCLATVFLATHTVAAENTTAPDPDCPCTNAPAPNTQPPKPPNKPQPVAKAQPPQPPQAAPPPVHAAPTPQTANAPTRGRGASILFLGDSLGLCGFGKSLDSRLRSSPDVSAVYTYMACGTVPISWLKTGPLARAHTGCGYWSIEGKQSEKAAEIKDTYGMEKGRRPGSHPVPKLENLLEEHHPDILIIQNGTNLLSLFSDGKTLLPARHEVQLRAYIYPFLEHLAEKAPTLKKVYWVCPPVSGRVTPEIQNFLFTRINTHASPFLQTIDSRTLITFPYKNTMPDKEHFIGHDMDLWAEGVFKIISQDVARGINRVEPTARQAILSGATKAGAPQKRRDLGTDREAITVKASLLSKSEPLTLERLLPYQESMVSYLYHVDSVLSGEYRESEIVVMHPAHIRSKPEALTEFKVGKSYKLELLDFEGSPWESIKRSEGTGRIELRPYIRKQDEARFPSLAR